jgi:hypothetical protein
MPPTTAAHRARPWFRVRLRLATVAQALKRYRMWAEAGWEAQHSNKVAQHQKPDGTVGEFTLKNPTPQRFPHHEHAARAPPTHRPPTGAAAPPAPITGRIGSPAVRRARRAARRARSWLTAGGTTR